MDFVSRKATCSLVTADGTSTACNSKTLQSGRAGLGVGSTTGWNALVANNYGDPVSNFALFRRISITVG